MALNAKPPCRFPADIPIIRSTFSMSPYGRVDSLAFRAGEIRRPIVDFIHRRGGLASINHPFLSSDPWMGGTPQDVARYLLTIGGAGADILEVGYGSLSLLADHVAVWDTLARNGLFLTANGASDDHSGEDWARQEGRFYTGNVGGRPDRAQPAGRPGPRPGLRRLPRVVPRHHRHDPGLRGADGRGVGRPADLP